MLRSLSRCSLTPVWSTSCRRFVGGCTLRRPEAALEFVQKMVSDRAEKELAVDTRKVLFASAASGDFRPRIAAARAFEAAAAALPRPPNFCYANISLDHAGMVDAPEVVWHNLCEVNGCTPSSVKRQQLHMLGGAVVRQRPGGGYIQLTLGCIPDLETDTFTFDAPPKEGEIHDVTRASPVVCFASLDTGLTLQHEPILLSRLNSLKKSLGTACPLIGGLYPPVQTTEAQVGGLSAMGESVCFMNDKILYGSAAAIVLRSRLIKTQSLSVVPSISLGIGMIDEMECFDKSICTLFKINGKPALDAIKDVYSLRELEGRPLRVFLGVQSGDAKVPFSFVGDPEKKTVQFYLPEGVMLCKGDVVHFLVDDVELDMEAAAGSLIAMEKQIMPFSAEKDIAVGGEARGNVITTSVAAFHFSHAGLNTIAKAEVPMLRLGRADTFFAPTLLQRCIGRTCTTSGIFCAGQVATVGKVTGIFSRASTYCFLQGIE